MKPDRDWGMVAIGLAVVAVAATLHSGLSLPRYRETILRKQRDLQSIQAHAHRWELEDEYRRQLDGAGAWQPADLDEIAVRILGRDVARVTSRPAKPVSDGWQVREVAVDLREVSFAEAGMLLAAASETRPAWRLREIDIRPSAEAGKGAMTMVLEALEKKR